MYIHQKQLDNLEKNMKPNKVVVVYGPRRTGKTTLLQKYLEKKHHYLLLNGEDRFAQQQLSSQSIQQLKNLIGHNSILVVDEAQKVPNIGINLKLCVDHIENLMVMATGSSALDLNQSIGEPLTGRQHILKMFPLSQLELNDIEDPATRLANLEARLIYGSYPEVILSSSNEDRKDYLIELVNSYLCKDILELEGLKRSKKIFDLLRLLALQIGSEVSLSELGQQLDLSKNTVAKYIDLLEQSFILIQVRAFSRNLRKEVSKSSKFYFYDLGVRNAIINNFNLIESRNDIGKLWENYLIIERLKKQHYTRIYAQNYFWRTYDQQEIDWVEEIDGQLYAYECKWGTQPAKQPKIWRETYPDSIFSTINKENYIDFIT